MNRNLRMKNIVALLILVCFQTLNAASPTLDQLLAELDRIVAHRQYYIQLKNERIAQEKEQMSRLPLTEQYFVAATLFSEYQHFQTDSALAYAKECVRLARFTPEKHHLQEAMIYQSTCYTMLGMYKDAEDLLVQVRHNMTREVSALYYMTIGEHCMWKSDFGRISTGADRLLELGRAYCDSALQLPCDPVFKLRWGLEKLLNEHPQEVPAKGRELLRTLDADHPAVRYVANTLGRYYADIHKTDSMKFYMAMSSIQDLKQGITEHTSLHMLAKQLFKEGDMERAYNYITCSIADANYCKARLRAIELMQTMPVLMNDYQDMNRQNEAGMKVGLAIMAVLLLIISGAVVGLMRTRQRLKRSQLKEITSNKALQEANAQLKDLLRSEKALLEASQATNRMLNESNQIKVTYVGQYLAECSRYLDKMDAYRKELVRMAKTDKIDLLLQTIRRTDKQEKEVALFFQGFDQTFLKLYPHFVDELNLLLRPEERFQIDGQKLSTELRIFALIRLGITDSNEIASFLRCSVKTVYNYRTKIRNNAVISKDELEQQIASMGKAEF